MKESENNPRSFHLEITAVPLWCLSFQTFFFSMCKHIHVKEWYCLPRVAGWLAFYHFTLAHRTFLSGNTGPCRDFTRRCGYSILYLIGSLLMDNYIAFSFGVIKKHCYECLCMSIFVHFSNYFLRINSQK